MKKTKAKTILIAAPIDNPPTEKMKAEKKARKKRLVYRGRYTRRDPEKDTPERAQARSQARAMHLTAEIIGRGVASVLADPHNFERGIAGGSTNLAMCSNMLDIAGKMAKMAEDAYDTGTPLSAEQWAAAERAAAIFNAGPLQTPTPPTEPPKKVKPN